MDLTKYYPDIVAKYPAYVTKRELCEICHICPKTAYNLEQQGEIPYTIEQNHLIRSHKIKLTDILAYLYRRECRQEADSPYICAMRTFYDEHLSPYEMLAGHNRQNAAAIANRELPCIVKENLSDEDAWIYVIETNVLQRSFSEMLPSEKAAVLALRYSKMICQGRRNDIIEELKRLENPDEIRENPTSGTQCHRTKSRDILGAEYDLKGRAVANYLRINELITPLKRRIDDAEFPIVVAVQLSYLTEQEQQMVDDVLSGSEYKVNEGKVVLLREYTGKLTPERTEQILSGEFNRKPKKSTATAFKVKPAIYKKYFTTSISQKEFDSIVDEALALYFAQKGQESEQEAG